MVNKYIYIAIIILLILCLILLNKKIFTGFLVLLSGGYLLHKSKTYIGNFEEEDIDNNILKKLVEKKYTLDIMLNRINFISKNANEIKPNFSCIQKNIEPNNIINYNNNKYICNYNIKDDKNTKKYKLKANLKDIITTSYMKSITTTDFKNYVFHILKFLNNGIRKIEILYNKKYNTNIINNYYIMYKGGNVINSYFKFYINQLKQYRHKYAIINFNVFINDIMKIGDWDFSLKIIDKTNLELNEIIKNSVMYFLSLINNSIGMNIHNVNTIIQNNLFNKNVNDMLYQFKKDINSYNKIYIKSIKTPYGNITKDSIDTTNVLSSEKSGITYIENNKKSSYMTVDSFISNTHMLNKNPTKTIYIKNLKFLKFKYKSSFDLAKVKINNIAQIVIDGKVEDIKLPAEIIDVSFINIQDDEQSNVINKNIKKDNSNSLTFIKHQNNTYPFYTPAYLFHDISYMLFTQEVYPWIDRKYEKRLKRYVTIGIIYDLSKYKVKDVKNNIIDIYDILLSISNININDCLPYLKDISKISCLSSIIKYIKRMSYVSRHLNNIEESEYSRKVFNIKNNPNTYADTNLFLNTGIPIDALRKSSRQDIIQFNIFIKKLCEYFKKNIEVLELLDNNFILDITKLSYVEI